MPRRDGVPELRLSYRLPFATGNLLAFLGRRAISGVELVTGGVYARSIRLPGHGPIVIGLAPDPVEPFVALRVTGLGGDATWLASVVRAARRLFDLDADPSSVDSVIAGDPVMRHHVRATPGMRVPGAVDGFEIAVRAIVGQQVSVAGARTTLGRIAERFGDALATPTGSIVRLFPTAERLADAPRDGLGMPGKRADALRAVARAVASGELDLSGTAEVEPTVETLRAIQGVGEWTAAYVAMRALGHPDAFPASDLGVRRAFAMLGLPDDLGSIHRYAERWRPWRAYAVMHLWGLEADRGA